MREIKFRAWESGNKKMWSHDEIDQSDKDGIVLWGELFKPKSNMLLMQYTSLKDKNGRDIYEYDIILNDDCFGCISSWGDYSDMFPKRRVVVFDFQYALFRMAFLENKIRDRSTSGMVFCKDNEKHFEIIGNIYENPELLEEINV